MSVNGVETFVLLFPNEEWNSRETDSQLEATVSQLRPNISFYQRIEDNFQTLSTQNADSDGTINGFLYVPDINKNDDCYELAKEYIPKNVTRQANLPSTDFTLISLAPWISAECTLAWLSAASEDPSRSFLFYLPDNGTAQPPDPSSPIWDLPDGVGWKSIYKYPVYIIPGSFGFQLMHNLALYSGNMTSVPWGHTISELPNVDPRDYVRMYTRLTVGNNSGLPSLWVFLLIVLGVLLVVCSTTSAVMHLIQRARRKSLEKRVMSGEVNLEALGIKRLTIPPALIERLPLFTYSAEPDISPPMSPESKTFASTILVGNNDPNHPQELTMVSPTNDFVLREPEIPPRLVTADDNLSNPESIFVHKFLPYSQPTCPICLDDYDTGVSEIRELPCGHIFHPACIDMFLGSHSSLCPLCKKSAFPVGFCPAKITNAMVARERNLRRIRSRVNIDVEAGDIETSGTRNRFTGLGASIKKTILHRSTTPPPLPLQPQPALMTSAVTEQQQSHDSFGSSRSRAEFVQQRIRELAARQSPIRDPDLIAERQMPKWRRTLAKAFPGF